MNPTPNRYVCFIHDKSRKSGSASVASSIAYFLKFQYITNMYINIKRKKAKKERERNEILYQNYLDNNKCGASHNVEDNETDKQNSIVSNNSIIENRRCHSTENSFCSYLDNKIFGPVLVEINKENIIFKRNHKGLVAKLVTLDEEKNPSDEIIRHNIQKVHFYEQIPECATLEDVFVSVIVIKCISYYISYSSN